MSTPNFLSIANAVYKLPKYARLAVWRSLQAVVVGDVERAARHIREAAQTMAADEALSRAGRPR